MNNSLENITQSLVKLLDTDNESKLYYAINTLDKLKQYSPIIVDKVLSLLKKHTTENNICDWGVRSSIITFLCNAGLKTPEFINNLLKLIGDEHFQVRHAVFSDLKYKMGLTTQELIDLLTNLLNDDNINIRFYAATFLVDLYQNQNNLNVTNIFINVLKDNNSHLRHIAACYLGYLKQDEPSVIINELTKVLDDDDKKVCVFATKSLFQLGDKELIKKLNIDVRMLSLLKYYDSNYIEHHKFFYITDDFFNKLENSTDVINALLNALINEVNDNSSNKCYFYMTIIKTLGKLAVNYSDIPSIVNTLLKILDKDDDNMQICIIETLYQLSQSSSEVISTILEAKNIADSFITLLFLLNDKCLIVIDFLDKLIRNDSSIIDMLLDKLKNNNIFSFNYHIINIEVLIKLGQKNPIIIDLMFQSLENDTNRIYYFFIFLKKLKQTTPIIVNSLIKLLDSDNDDTFRHSIEVLTILGEELLIEKINN